MNIRRNIRIETIEKFTPYRSFLASWRDTHGSQASLRNLNEIQIVFQPLWPRHLTDDLEKQSMMITPVNFVMIRWEEHYEKRVTDGRN